MDYQQYIRLYDNLQRDYFSILSSKEYAIGKKLCLWFEAVKRRQLYKQLKQEVSWRRIGRFDKKVPPSSFEYGEFPTPLPKIAVYSCITGGYDLPLSPLMKPSNVDYLLFTDEKPLNLEYWTFKDLPKEALQYKDNTLRNRYCKMHPQIVGEGFDYAIYIDGNIKVYSDLTNIINAINSKTGLAIHRHNCRNCIYDEVEVCKIAKRGNIPLLDKQIRYYKAEGMPIHYGLLECSVIVSDLSNCKVNVIMSAWWNEFMRSSSKRDQISLPFVLWKLGYKIEDIGNLGWELTKNPKFRKIEHIRQ